MSASTEVLRKFIKERYDAFELHGLVPVFLTETFIEGYISDNKVKFSYLGHLPEMKVHLTEEKFTRTLREAFRSMAGSQIFGVRLSKLDLNYMYKSMIDNPEYKDFLSMRVDANGSICLHFNRSEVYENFLLLVQKLPNKQLDVIQRFNQKLTIEDSSLFDFTNDLIDEFNRILDFYNSVQPFFFVKNLLEDELNHLSNIYKQTINS